MFQETVEQKLDAEIVEGAAKEDGRGFFRKHGGVIPLMPGVFQHFEFQGVYDRQTKLMHLFERTVGGQYRAPVQVGGLDDPAVRGQLDDETYGTELAAATGRDRAGDRPVSGARDLPERSYLERAGDD
ncbi:MAG: hypothetical protein ACLQBX_09010 [Candidatus Limnocylindrales bacterium]